jgi:formate dehydrogenase gamma subunit
VRWIRTLYLWIIPFTLGFMVLHNLIDLIAKLRRREHPEPGGPMVVRLDKTFRIVHAGLLSSFLVLVVTGFALKYPEAIWARPLLLWEGHFAFRGALHRAAAVLLMITMAYHLITFALYKKQREFLKAMLPVPKDATSILQVFRYNLGLTDKQPQFARFNYAEKIEYWALLWGAIVMAVSGCLLWFNNFSLQHFPKWVTDAATAVHWYEAILATFSILLWHFYMVIFDPTVYPMDLAWLTGRIPASHYRHTRPEYLRSIEEPEDELSISEQAECDDDAHLQADEQPEMQETGKGHTAD